MECFYIWNILMSRRPYILAADDEPLNRLIIEEIIDDQVDLAFVEDGQACLDSVNRRKPDLILMDSNMPVLNGLETTRTIKAMHCGASIPIILISALASKADIESGLQSGADDYITKPFEEKTLLKLINQYLGTKL